MAQTRPHLISTEESHTLPILIIDKYGQLGSALTEKLKQQFLTVLVSGKELEFHNNIVHIPYRKKIPVIPDNSYSHIFVFYNGEEEILEMLSSLMKKANETGGRVFFLTALTHSSEQLFKRLDQHVFHSLKVILYGEIFDQKAVNPNMVNLFIHQSRTNGRIMIPNEGVGKLYPVFLDDLMIVIIAAAFSHETKKGNLFVFPRHPFTEITVAHIFQKINPDLKIDFNKRKILNSNYFIPLEGEYAYKNYNLEEGLKQIDLKSSGGVSFKVSKAPSVPKRKTRINLKFLLIIILVFLIVPILIILLTAGAGSVFAIQSVRQAEGGNFQLASKLGSYGSASFAVSGTVAQNYFPADFIAKSSKDDFVNSMQAGQQIADIESELFASFRVFSNIYHNKAGGSAKEDFMSALANVKNSLIKLEEIKAQNKLPKNLQAKLNENSYMITLLENTIDAMPQILGFNGKKKYLLLFQNNMELRPGGGFIGSYAIVNIENGQIGKIDIHDVYDADGKLKTHVEPPYGLRRYGGVTHWFLHDSNFDIDFTTNAAAAADILARETNDRVEGVIGIDTNFIKNIISVLGSVRVDDYKEEVNAGNFYLLTQKHAEDNFFPGSTQKKDFLRSLLNSTLTDISEKKNISFTALSRAVEKSIKEKHLLFTFVDPSIQKTFTANNLSGGIYDARSVSENSITDFFGTFDANLGANKDNYYLKRTIDQNVSISNNGGVEETATVDYENTSTKTSAFGGDYKNYVRFVLPTGADLKIVNIDGRNTPITSAIISPSIFNSFGFIPPPELEVETTEVNSKEVVAFFLIVPVQSSKKVAITYTVPQVVNAASPAFSYDLRVIKQPGTDMDPYSLTLNYPNKFKPIDLNTGVVDLGGKVVYQTNLNEDKNIKIQFSQK